VWVGGSWRFRTGKYEWEKGHWEARHEGEALQPARWVEANGHWEHHSAHWARPGAPPPPPPGRPGEPRPPEHR
jgi:hypothetical protein